MPGSIRLRELASWYREFAERTENPLIWEARLLMADDLDKEADLIDRGLQDEPRNKEPAVAAASGPYTGAKAKR